MLQEVQMGLVALTLIAAVVAPVIAVLRLRAAQKAETERLMAKMEESLGASVKLLEVRNYYEQMSGELKRMLDEALKEGNRFRQDHLRRMIERLEQLKARTLDRTTRLLEAENSERPSRNRRRRGGRHGGQGQGQQGQGQQGRPQGGQQGRPQNQPPRGPQPPRPQGQPPRPPQPPRQEPPKQEPPKPEPPRGEKPPSTDPRTEESPSPFEE